MSETLGDWDYYADHTLPSFSTGPGMCEGRLDKAEEGLALMLSQREARISKLAKLLAPIGIKLDGSNDCLDALNRYFAENVSQESGSDHITPEWAEVCADIGVYLGELIIQRYPICAWHILETEDKDFMDYLKIGVGPREPVNNCYLGFDVFDTLFHFGYDIVNDTVYEKVMLHSYFSILLARMAIYLFDTDVDTFELTGLEILELGNKLAPPLLKN